MGQVNCCQPNAEKDLFMKTYLQADKFKEVEGNEVDQRVKPALESFQYDQGFSNLQEKHGTEKWWKHTDKEEYYLGDWDNAEMRGIGILYIPDKFAYFGDFYRTPNGRGRLINYPHNVTYVGEIEKGSINGEGKVTHNEGLYQFEGTLSEGRPVRGNLVVYNPENRSFRYRAEIVDDPQLKARISFSDQRYYEGQFEPKTFLPEGRGRMDYPNGNNYEGEWKGGQFHGNGKFSWQDGSSYSGEYVEGVKHGQGRFVYPNRRYYDGAWENGKQHGEGRMCDESDNAIRQGSWQNGGYQG